MKTLLLSLLLIIPHLSHADEKTDYCDGYAKARLEVLRAAKEKSKIPEIGNSKYDKMLTDYKETCEKGFERKFKPALDEIVSSMKQAQVNNPGLKIDIKKIGCEFSAAWQYKKISSRNDVNSPEFMKIQGDICNKL